MSILLIGATGLVGTRLAAQLAGRDDVRALARSEATATRLTDAGVTAVRGDLADPASLTQAFDGVRRLFLLTPYGPQQTALEHAALDAAERAGVTGVVYLSLIGADLDIAFARPHRQVEARLAASPLATTVLRPDFFAQNLHGQLDLIRQASIVFPAGDTALAPIDVEDIAAAAAAALTAPAQPTGAYTLTGPQRLTFADIAARTGAALNRTVTYVDAPPSVWHQGLLDAGVPPLFADGYSEMFDVYRQTGGTYVTHGVRQLTGTAPRPLEAFLDAELLPSINQQQPA
ncbi:NmrA family NAD(P)-binding protein [Actinoplanes sp. CA-030573]|uniref:NmrA family NAD(P)-binding protein n=1 Tax=Actinoplanes sp. CA-030573 TaxID=3239898 RepID=UPI003D8A3EEE